MKVYRNSSCIKNLIFKIFVARSVCLVRIIFEAAELIWTEMSLAVRNKMLFGTQEGVSYINRCPFYMQIIQPLNNVNIYAKYKDLAACIIHTHCVKKILEAHITF